jgi:hypothetical protein
MLALPVAHLMQILQGTSGMAERSEIRSGASTFNVSNDSTPLTHTYTRMVNVAVVDRPNLPFSEQAQASQSPGAEAERDDRHFTVKETTVMPQRTGMSLLMFDLCCAAPRVQQRKPGGSMSGRKIVEKDPMPQTSRSELCTRFVVSQPFLTHPLPPPFPSRTYTVSRCGL